MTSVPRTKVNKKNRFDQFVDDLIVLMVLQKGSMAYLKKIKQLTPPLLLKLQIEIDFIDSILLYLAKINPNYIIRVQHQLWEGEDFKGQVEKFVERLVPGSTKKGLQLYSWDDMKKEIIGSHQRDSAIKGKGRIII